MSNDEMADTERIEYVSETTSLFTAEHRQTRDDHHQSRLQISNDESDDNR